MNVLATVLDSCLNCGKARLVQPSRTGRLCKACHNARASKVPRKYQNKNCEHCGEVILSAHPKQKWCKRCCPDARASARLKLYDMSQPEFDAQKSKQGNLCAICRKNPPTDADHNHETGENRELLCAWCNHGLAYLEDAEWKKNAEIYLEKHSEETVNSLDSKAV